MWWRISDRPPVLAEQHARGGEPEWGRIVGLGAVLTGITFAAGTLVSVIRVPALAVIVGCIAVAAAVAMAALMKAGTGLSAAYWAACGVAASGWMAFARTAAGWSWTAAAALLVVAAVLTTLYPAVRARADRAAELARSAAAAAAVLQEQRKWPDLLARVGHKGIMFAGQHDTLAGYMVHLRLPGTGRVTYTVLVPATEQLEVAARLRHGSLRFERGEQAHEVILHVAERDVLAETVPLPAGHGTLSIIQPVPVGLFEDGRPCAVTLREVAALIVGLRGSGKSNLLNVLMAQLARCADVLIFALDVKGGRMAAPWIEPWLAGRTARPVVDWLATDREEAERMLRALLRAVDARSRSGSGGEKIIPSPRQPAILLVCDEIAVILGVGTGGPRSSLEGVTNATLAGLATQLVMTGRSEAIDLIMATQRGTVTMTGSADLKSQCALRIGLGVASEADARLVIPDDVRIAADLARLRHPGTGIIQQGKHGRVLPAKFYRIEYQAIGPIAERYGWIRPGPDKLLEDALGEDYATRWSRGPAARIRGGGGRHQPAAAPAGIAGIAAPSGSAGEQLARLASGRGMIRPGVTRPGPPEETGHPDRRRMAAMLRAAGVRGMTASRIGEQLAADGREVARQTIHRWLTEEVAAGRVENASYGRWKWRAGQ